MTSRPRVWIISYPTPGDNEGHNLLGRHLAASSCKISGWTGSAPERFFAKLLRRFPAYHGLSPFVAYEVFLANCICRLPRSRVDMLHIIWGDEPIERVTRPGRCIFTLHQPHELWTDFTWRRIAASAG